MNKVLYDKKSSLTFPSGKTYTYDELRNNSAYSILGMMPCVLTEEAGIVMAIEPLYQLKQTYGVTTEDDEQALQECIEKEKELAEKNRNEMTSLQDLQEEIDALVGNDATEE